jgi:hypothetical protein
MDDPIYSYEYGPLMVDRLTLDPHWTYVLDLLSYERLHILYLQAPSCLRRCNGRVTATFFTKLWRGWMEKEKKSGRWKENPHLCVLEYNSDHYHIIAGNTEF